MKVNNKILLNLPADQREDILATAEFVHLDVHERVIEPNVPIKYVDFIESGVISIVTPIEQSLIEVGNIGLEGFSGLPLLNDLEVVEELSFCQVEGTSWRLKTSEFQDLYRKFPELALLCKRYSATFSNQVARNVGCNRFHLIDQRTAKWLLLTHDRVQGDEFVITQDFLSIMLGVTRSGVNAAASALAKAELIRYVRGRITIVNRAGLEQAACECYAKTDAFFLKTMGYSTSKRQLPVEYNKSFHRV